ncbi:tetratricopeptide repeat protein [Niveispirillum sp.]|uniref:tetratricopeptide repeat protein n=1 Tax=Niveispirillum sp. TaxID=1917217 RepID=UPI001B5A5FD0|nr:tetratricopeptide repeat protein [Niveispirillum sp.]MBP7337001.1 tetratricopeptide repeat protein [Niveispirillum sp.]
MRVDKKLLLGALSLLLAGSALASADPAMDARIGELQAGWAHVKYEIKGTDAQLPAMEALATEAKSVTAAYPGKAEPLIWEAIILSSEAGIKGGIGALSLVKEAKAKLETAEKIDPTALDGSVNTSLGSLYYQVPGWPVGFGSDKQAKVYLEKALALNPDGIDPNYFYGDFLFRQGDYAKARDVLNHALAATPRPGREVADAGRREEINSVLAQLETKLAKR